MRDFRWIFFVIVFLSFTHTLFSQIPGYLGKRTVIGYGFNFHPALAGFSMGYSDSPFNVKHEIFVEHAIKSRTMLGASAQFYNYVYNNSDLAEPNKSHSRYSFTGVKPNGTYQISAQNFVLRGKFFKNNYLAPWGRYVTLGIVYTRYRTEYRSSEMFVRSNASNSTQTMLSDFGPLQQNYQTADVLFGTGRSRILGDKVVFDYGCNMQLASAVRFLLSPLNAGESLYLDEYIKITSARRVSATNFLNFYMKLGLLF